ncbi:Uncharacterised protein [Mycobacteroides abscessus subsp. abscessus]|nr:Uncharacterised protein [Mycobacteroides abscessus]SHT39393.1 Uncharacterised protein [Mycobacteroides abscessus subsp. abscessus]
MMLVFNWLATCPATSALSVAPDDVTPYTTFPVV